MFIIPHLLVICISILVYLLFKFIANIVLEYTEEEIDKYKRDKTGLYKKELKHFIFVLFIVFILFVVYLFL